MLLRLTYFKLSQCSFTKEKLSIALLNVSHYCSEYWLINIEISVAHYSWVHRDRIHAIGGAILQFYDSFGMIIMMWRSESCYSVMADPLPALSCTPSGTVLEHAVESWIEKKNINEVSFKFILLSVVFQQNILIGKSWDLKPSLLYFQKQCFILNMGLGMRQQSSILKTYQTVQCNS